MIALDFLGNQIDCEDEVVFVRKNYRSFGKGKISKITTYNVFIAIDGEKGLFKQAHNQIIVIKK